MGGGLLAFSAAISQTLALGAPPLGEEGVTSQVFPGEVTPFDQGQLSGEGHSHEPPAGNSSGSWDWEHPPAQKMGSGH